LISYKWRDSRKSFMYNLFRIFLIFMLLSMAVMASLYYWKDELATIMIITWMVIMGYLLFASAFKRFKDFNIDIRLNMLLALIYVWWAISVAEIWVQLNGLLEWAVSYWLVFIFIIQNIILVFFKWTAWTNRYWMQKNSLNENLFEWSSDIRQMNNLWTSYVDQELKTYFK